MWILIKWLHQKPADLDLVFSKKDKFGFSRTRAKKRCSFNKQNKMLYDVNYILTVDSKIDENHCKQKI